MTKQRRILLVAPTVTVAQEAIACLLPRGYTILLMTDHANAMREIDRKPPDVLITEAKLGAFNGLQLAIHAAASSMPAIVIGTADRHFAAEAEKCQAVYLSTPLGDSLPFTAQRLIERRSAHAVLAARAQSTATRLTRRSEARGAGASRLLTH